MLFSTLFAATAFVSSALAADHSIKVGGNNGELTFTPNNVNASKGDTVTFHYWPKNHSVAQAAFAKPCEPLDGGFWSGYIASTNNAAAETFMVTVTDTSKPIWFYCTQAKHCQSGMVGAINAPSTGNTVTGFASAAKAVSNNTQPSSKAGTGGMLMQGNSASASASSGSATPTGSSGTSSTGAASALELNKGVAFTGLLGMFAYFML